MKNLCKQLLTLTLSFLLVMTLTRPANAQPCSPAGNQSSYGNTNVWIGYVYQGKNFDTYKGYVNEGAGPDPNFDESFGGDNVTYNTNGCPITTDNFSVRYKLAKTFAAGNYQFTIGGDDGYRFSLDGGATWVINNWGDHSYATSTYNIGFASSTSVNMVLEFYENGGANRISFNVINTCGGTGDPSVYGTNNIWKGYIYQGMNFEQYKGDVTEGITASPNFNETFGNPSGSNSAIYNTNTCAVTTYHFSARYRLQLVLTPAHYNFTIGGDDGYRFSVDGGATWVINKWNDQSYGITSAVVVLSGTVNMVLEYYQNGGYDRVSFSMTKTTLPVSLVTWSVSALATDQALLKWEATDAVNFDHYTIQRSTDGATFQDIHQTPATNGSALQKYSYTDPVTNNNALYYRLAMVDLDGATTYSNIISISLHNAQHIRIYPTVVENGTLTVESARSISGAKLELFDMTGSRITEKSWAVLDGRQQLSIAGNKSAPLPAGAYIARLSDGHTVLAKQIIMIR